jgi:hypothetical protein
MSKSKNRRSKATKRKLRSLAPYQRSVVSRLDQAAREHLRLILDPCNGPITAPAYPNPGGGTLIRMRNAFTIGANAGETAFLLHVVPALNLHYANGAAAPTTTFTPTANVTFPPLSSDSTQDSTTYYRPIACCVKVISLSSEMSRKGVLYAGHTDGRFVRSRAANATVNNFYSVLPYMTRTPDKSLELMWVPNLVDGEFQFNDNNVGGDSGAGGSGPAAVTIAGTGLEAGVGVQVEITTVYEVQAAGPGSGYGYMVNTKTPPPSSTPFVDIVKSVFDITGGFPALLDGAKAALGNPTIRGALTSMAGPATMAAQYGYQTMRSLQSTAPMLALTL